MSRLDRRQFGLTLSAGLTSAVAGTLSLAGPRLAQAAAPVAKRILLRSSWQVVNIGDIAHTPGVLALIEKHLPQAEVRLWASADLTPEVIAMEHQRFPNLEIVQGSINAEGHASNAELAEALQWCDFLLHGSGPFLVAQRDVSAFIAHVGKPWGVYGITYPGGNQAAASLIGQAEFAFFRDSVSLSKARAEQVACPRMEFAPDGAFACDLRNDAAAEEWLKQHELQPGKFACCLPRARYTPYWLIREGTPVDPDKEARNAAMFDHDHAPLRQAITQIVRQTDLKVLICPEDQTQVAIGREWLYDKLPDDVQSKVVWRDTFWLTDEALSTYVRSAGIFGLEMHSPIMCIGNGIPAIVGRFAEQTSKGYMWRDIGLDDWLFDFDSQVDTRRFPDVVLEMLTNPTRAAAKVQRARHFVQQRQAETICALGRG